jgi:hypothetical protein
MARGKAAAQSANRRAEAAQTELAQLKAQFTEFRKTAEKREADLLDELQRTKNRLVREVDALARDAVRRAEMQVEQVRLEEREAARERVITGWEAMKRAKAEQGDGPISMMRIAEAFGVSVTDFDPVFRRASRSGRRARHSHIRKGMSLVDQVRNLPPTQETGLDVAKQAASEIDRLDREKVWSDRQQSGAG